VAAKGCHTVSVIFTREIDRPERSTRRNGIEADVKHPHVPIPGGDLTIMPFLLVCSGKFFKAEI